MFGGKLAEVESSTEDSFLKQRIRQLHVSGLEKISIAIIFFKDLWVMQ